MRSAALDHTLDEDKVLGRDWGSAGVKIVQRLRKRSGNKRTTLCGLTAGWLPSTRCVRICGSFLARRAQLGPIGEGEGEPGRDRREESGARDRYLVRRTVEVR